MPNPVIPNGPSLLPRLQALAASGTAGLRTGSQWQAWLRRAERFSPLGFTNTMLIWAQAPDAVLVNSYQGWRRHGRQVVSGSSGIRLIVRGKGGAEGVRTFFDLLQTEGEPVRVPQPRSALDDVGADGHAWETLGSLAGREGFRIVVGGRGSGIDWGQRMITIDPDGDRAAALAHQAAHMLLRHQGDGLVHDTVCTGARKAEADSLAYLILRRFGMDASAIAFPYVTSWAGADPRTDRVRVIAAAGERITAAASKAFACIDASPHSPARPVIGPRQAAAPALPRRAAASPAPVVGERARSLALVQAEALRFFTDQVRRSWVPSYLEGRGFGAAARRNWGAGYAPGTWTAVTDHLRDLGFADEVIEASGLAKRSSRSTLIDVFRDRAVFPVRAPDGTVLGFIGRAASDAGPEVPKYLNSRETQIYRKGRVLFGLHEGSSSLAAGATPVIVEGPVDAMAVTLAGDGRYAGVAPCGTAFTVEQLGELARVCNLRASGVLAAFDADEAGRKAAVRAYDLLAGVTGRPMILVLPAGQDPAGVFAEQGPEALRLALATLVRPLADTVIDQRIAEHRSTLDSIDGKFNAVGAVAPVIARMAPVEWPRQAIRVSAQTGLTPAEVTDAVIEAMPGADPRAGPSPGRAAMVAANDMPGPPEAVPFMTAQKGGGPVERPVLTPTQVRRSMQ